MADSTIDQSTPGAHQALDGGQLPFLASLLEPFRASFSASFLNCFPTRFPGCFPERLLYSLFGLFVNQLRDVIHDITSRSRYLPAQFPAEPLPISSRCVA